MEKKIIIIMMALLSMRVYSQNTSEKEGIIYKINDDGSHYLQATVLNQTWVRLNQNNSGTMVDGIAQNNTFDIGLRRTRMQVFGQVTDRAFVYFQFGQNNFNAVYNSNSNRKVAAFFHDVVDILTIDDIMHGLTKSFLFAILITVIGVVNGAGVQGGADGVGKATTRSVVQAISAIVMTDMIFAFVATG